MLPWVFFVLFALCGLICWVDPLWRPHWDSSLYLLTGKTLAAGAGYTYLGEPFFLRPPGFPWLLSLFVREDGTYDFLELNRVVLLFAAATLPAIYLAMRPEYGHWLAFAVAVLTATCPLFLRLLNGVMSDFPFVCLLFVAIALLHRAGQRGERWWAWAVGGAIALTGAIYLRTAGAVMLPALLLVGLWRDRGAGRWRAVAPLILVVLLVSPWWLHASRAASQATWPVEQLLNFDYATAVLHVDPGDPGSDRVSAAAWAARIRANGGALTRTFSAVCIGSDSRWAQALLVGLVLSGAAWATWRRASLLECFAATYGLVILTYFTYSERLVLPLVPLVYLYLLATCSVAAVWLRDRWNGNGTRLGAMGSTVVFMLLLGLNLRHMPDSLHPETVGAGSLTMGDYWENTRTIAAWIRENIRDDAVILCNEAPILALLTGRRTFTFRHARDEKLLERYSPDYVLFYHSGPQFLRDQVARVATERKMISLGKWGEVPIFRIQQRPGSAPN